MYTSIYITVLVWKLQHSICFKKTWVHTPLKNSLKTLLESFGIILERWESLAQQRDAWRYVITDRATTFEEERIKGSQVPKNGKIYLLHVPAIKFI